MRLTTHSLEFPLGTMLESLLPDFVLAFAFFAALAYAVLARRFELRRPAAVISAVIGFALAVGLVWWEQRTGLSIRDLGPLAVGFAILILAATMYQAIKQVGGAWAGIGLAVGLSLLISRLLQLDWTLTEVGHVRHSHHHHDHQSHGKNSQQALSRCAAPISRLH